MAEPARAAWRPYAVLLGSRLREQISYRTSFALDVFGAVLIAMTELAEVYVVFHNVSVFGGVTFPAALLIFALAHLAFGLANALAGSLDTIPQFIRTGTLDVLMLRPLPVLGQLLTAEVTLKRIGQAGPPLMLLPIALSQLDLRWTPSAIALLAITPISGALIFAALFLIAGSLQFWLLDGAELTNSITYGSSYAATFPSSVLPFPLRIFFSFVVPAAFIGYLPAVSILGLPGGPGLPAWLGWCLPGVALASWGVALAAWRQGLRCYTSAGG
jgi:ABC-2 type transport system permease protein